ncbi:MAG: threonine ammonia-lyase [Clostridiales Family XIII bacterium]|jgi:threonine dehydratase|nr:threonine ammonia-lyase [Clostridiales Family XIII bacterium]
MKKESVEAFLKRDHKEDILKAAEGLRSVLRPTHLIHSGFFSAEHGCEVYLKPENLQVTGSYKIRGAYNKIMGLSPQEKERGVIAASAGNHAQGVSLSAQMLKIPATIVMPSTTPLLKISSAKARGAEVALHGDVFDDAYNKALAMKDETGACFIHPFDDYDIICGQGTAGLEILADLPDVDEILVPIGGGGLIAGISLIVKAMSPKTKVVGAVPVGAMSMKISIDEGQVTRLASVKTSAEGVAVKQPGELPFAIAKRHVDEIVTVTEKDIMEAVLLLLERHKLVSETAGAVSLAALKKRARPGKKVVCFISGGNIDMVTISSIINQGMISRGRIMCFSVELPDRPGQLVKVAQLLAENNANVIELEHNQFKAIDRYSNKVALEVTVETNGHEHIQQVLNVLEDNNFTVARIY